MFGCCYSRSKPYKPLEKGEAPLPAKRDNEPSVSVSQNTTAPATNGAKKLTRKGSESDLSNQEDKLQLKVNTKSTDKTDIDSDSSVDSHGRLENTRAADARSAVKTGSQSSQSPSTHSGSQSPSLTVTNAAAQKRTALPTLVRAGSVPERKFDTKGAPAPGVADSRLERQGSFPKPVLRRSSSFAGDPKQQAAGSRKSVRFSGLDSDSGSDSDSDSDSESEGRISVRNLSQSNLNKAPAAGLNKITEESRSNQSSTASLVSGTMDSSQSRPSAGASAANNRNAPTQLAPPANDDRNYSASSFASNSSGVLLTPPSSTSLTEPPASDVSKRSLPTSPVVNPTPAPAPPPAVKPPPSPQAQAPRPEEKKAPEPPKKAAPAPAPAPAPEPKKKEEEKKEDKGKEIASARYKIEYSPGKITDKYEITDTFLGSGAFGVVKLAIGKGLPPGQAEFAVKIIPRSNMILKDAEFMEEVEVLSRMHHQNIISLVDKYETDQNVYLVMELASGGELFERVIEEKKLDEREVRFIAAQLFEAIAYLHAQGICHRDLKPENILFKENQRWSPIKVTDFGFAKHLNNGQQQMRASAKRGTMGYAAPEIFSGKPYSEKCDVWSAGIIVHIMLSGVPPFCELPPPDQALRIPFWRHANKMKKIPTSTPDFPTEFWRGISDNAKHFLTQALNPDPVKRARAVDLCRHPWLKPEKNKAVATATFVASGPLPNVNAKLSLR